MADAYRGLTIRFGGDTSKLEAALRSARRAASDTQRQLSQINRAMRFDTGNLGNVETKMRLLSNRAEDLSSQLNVTRTKMADLGKATATGSYKTVSELASETENAGLAAAKANERYNEINKQLEATYTTVNRLAREGGLGQAFDIRKDASGVEEAARTLQELGVISEEDADRLIQLRSAWQEASYALDASKQVSELEQMGTKCQLLESEITSVTKTMAQMRVPTDLTASAESTREAIERIDASAKLLEGDLSRADEALRFDPSNMAAASQKMADLAQLSDLAAGRARLIQGELDSMSARGVDEVASGMGNVTLEVERTKAAWQQADEQLSRAKADLANLRTEQDKVGDSAGKSSEQYRAAGQAVDAAEQQVRQLQQAADEAAQALAQAGDAQRFQELSGELSECTSKAQAYRDAMTGAGQESESSLGRVSGHVAALGAALSANVTPLVQRIGQSAMQSAQDVDSAYRDMRKTVNGTESDFEALRQSAIDFSTTHVTSADQMLSIQAMGGELGIATDQLDEFARTVSNVDVATNLSSEDAATALGQLSNITRDTAGNLTGFGDALVRLGNNGASTETQIVDVAKRIGSMGSIVGMSTPDILAWSSTIASTGQNAEAAGTAIAKTMSDIEGAVAAGGDSLEAFASVSQMSAEDFANTWNTDPTAALKAFIEGLSQVEAEGGSADATLVSLGITGVRQKQAIMGLMQTIGGLNDNLTMSNDAWNGVSDAWGQAGDAANEADKKAEGFSGTVSQIQNIAQDAGAALGDALLPALQGLRDAAQAAYDGFMSLDDGQKQLIAGAGALAGALGPGLTIAGTLGLNFEDLRKKMAASKTAWATMQRGAAVAFGVLGEGEHTATEVAQAISGLTTAQKLSYAASQLMAKGATLAKAGLIGLSVAGVAYVIGSIAQKFQEAAEHEQLLADATKPLTSILGDAAHAADGMGSAIADIEPDTQGVLESMRQLQDSVKETFSEYQVNSAKLDQYVDVIDRLANKSNLSATEQYQLTEAVKGYNDITGSQYSVVDAVNGKIEDQTGKLQENTDEIDNNAEAWKRKAKADAYSDVATQYLEQQIKAQNELSIAQDKLSDARARFNELDAKGNAKTHDEILEWNELYHNTIPGLEQDVSDLTDTWETCGKSTDLAARQAAIAMSDLSEEGQAAANGIADSVDAMSQNARAALQNAGVDVADLSIRLAAAGVSSEQMEQIGSDAFARMAQNCGGSIDTLVWMIQHYNDTPVVDKYGNVTVNDAELVDANGQVVVWNGETLVYKETGAKVEDGELRDALGNVYTWNDEQLKPKDATAQVDGNAQDGSAEQAVEDTNGAVQGMSGNSVTATVSGNAVDGSARRELENLKDSIGGLASKSITIAAKLVSQVPHASGGVIAHAKGAVLPPVQYHASGFIANRATDVTRHIVGEAGAEAVIPLTNRRYTGPFTDLVSEKVVAALSAQVDEINRQQREVATAALRLADASAAQGQMGAVVAAIETLQRALGPIISQNAPTVTVSDRDQGRYIESLGFVR